MRRPLTFSPPAWMPATMSSVATVFLHLAIGYVLIASTDALLRGTALRTLFALAHPYTWAGLCGIIVVLILCRVWSIWTWRAGNVLAVMLWTAWTTDLAITMITNRNVALLATAALSLYVAASHFSNMGRDEK